MSNERTVTYGKICPYACNPVPVDARNRMGRMFLRQLSIGALPPDLN